MSDKDWFESMPSPFDKPAATVHGTGSGEATCPKCGGARNKPRLLWTRTTGLGDVECGPVCTDDFHQAELTALREEVERLKGALEIAFVQGAQWWEWERTSFTMWGADRNRAEAEAAKLNAAGTLGMTYEERMKRAAALSPSPAQQESDPAGL